MRQVQNTYEIPVTCGTINALNTQENIINKKVPLDAIDPKNLCLASIMFTCFVLKNRSFSISTKVVDDLVP
jgi:hypothetical protein